MNADGSNQRRLARKIGSAMWSPDSTQIAFYYDADGDFEIYVKDVDGANQHNLTSDKPLYIDFKDSTYYCEDVDPVWSPDGSRIVFARTSESKTFIYRDQDFRIWVIDADGSDKQCLTSNEDDDVCPRWVPRQRGVEVNEESIIIPALAT
jgi:TolB protein